MHQRNRSNPQIHTNWHRYRTTISHTIRTLKKIYAVSIRYAGDCELAARNTYGPDFVSIASLLEEDRLAYEGDDGSYGGDG